MTVPYFRYSQSKTHCKEVSYALIDAQSWFSSFEQTDKVKFLMQKYIVGLYCILLHEFFRAQAKIS